VRYQLDNHLGSAALEADGQAQVITYEEYHPYGSTAYAVVLAIGLEISEINAFGLAGGNLARADLALGHLADALAAGVVDVIGSLRVAGRRCGPAATRNPTLPNSEKAMTVQRDILHMATPAVVALRGRSVAFSMSNRP
jgi:hypothetical protein